jgi:hypothetical protein
MIVAFISFIPPAWVYPSVQGPVSGLFHMYLMGLLWSFGLFIYIYIYFSFLSFSIHMITAETPNFLLSHRPSYALFLYLMLLNPMELSLVWLEMDSIGRSCHVLTFNIPFH